MSSGNVDHIDNEVSNNLRHTTISSTTTTTLISTTEKTVNTFVCVHDNTAKFVSLRILFFVYFGIF